MKKQIGLFWIIIIAFFLQSSMVKGQYVLTEADEQYNLYNYDKAIDLYEKAYKKKATLHAAERLAVCYSYQKKYKEIESWYAIASALPGSSIENKLGYATALKANGKYGEAKIQYRQYAKANAKLSMTEQDNWLLSCDSAIRWMRSPVPVTLVNEESLNSVQSDWGAVLYKNNIVFVSDRLNGISKQESKFFLKFDGSKQPDKHIYGWTGNAYFKLYRKEPNGAVQLFSIDAATDYHVGPASFTSDDSEIYFAMAKVPSNPDYKKEGDKNEKLAAVNIGIYHSKKDVNGKWGKAQPFTYNNVNEYSNADPYITADGKSLYFSSNRAGGKGGSDLYVSHQTDAGGWGQPINLKELNTAGNERYIFFDKNNLYFSSDGYIGMGGMDIFRSEIFAGQFSPPVNLGYPFNSPQDDFAYIKTSNITGYLSSNRDGGKGDDDIYSFSTVAEAKTYKLVGTVYDKTSGKPLSHALVSLKKSAGYLLQLETNETGAFSFNIVEFADYNLNGEKTNFRSEQINITSQNLQISDILKRDLYLEQIETGKAIRLNSIYYDFDRSDIRSDAAIELDKLVKIMEDNPTIWIELGSHTDSRGRGAYNLALSQDRADAAIAYIISKGVSINRITARGYGETMPINSCVNGVKCTEEEYQLNRRTEFKIIKQ